MKLKTLLTALKESRVSGPDSVSISNLEVDSRNVQRGTCYIAIPGVHVDGATFIDDALSKGAHAVVTERPCPETLPKNVAWVQVKEAHIAAGLLADAWYKHPSRHMKVVGVTGTNGKTTTTYLLQSIFKKRWMRAGLLGTIVNDDGVNRLSAAQTTMGPLPLQEIMATMNVHGCRAMAMEVSSHALSQDRVSGVDWNAAIFTNLTQDHLDYHHTMEEYFQAKVKLFEQLANQEGRKKPTAVINIDDPYGERLANEFADRINVKTFGMSLKADFRMVPHSMTARGSDFQLEYAGKSYLVRIPLIGRFNMYNSLGALAGAVSVGISVRDAIALLAECPQVPGRMELAGSRAGYSVFVDYAHTPDALENVCKTLRELCSGRLIVVFGCGGDRDKTKRPIMGATTARIADRCIVTSDNPRSEDPQDIINDIVAGMPKGSAVMVPDRAEAIQKAISEARKGDIVLIAGKGHERYQEFADGRIDFSDLGVARRVMRTLEEEFLQARLAEEKEEKPKRNDRPRRK